MSRKRAREAPIEKAKPVAPVIAADYNGRKIALPRRADYQEMIAFIKRAIKPLSNIHHNQITLSARFEGLDDSLEIPGELWPELLPSLTLVAIKADGAIPVVDAAQSVDLDDDVQIVEEDQLFVQGSHKRKRQDLMQIVLESFISTHTSIWQVGDTIAQFKKVVHNKTGLGPKKQYLSYEGMRVRDTDTFQGLGVAGGDTITVMCEQVGEKPVIYLFPPSCVANVQVHLSLSKSWKFSELYPIQFGGHLHESIGDDITWTVDAMPDGTLLDHATQRQVAYLFWEAHAEPALPMSPSCSRPTTPTQQPMILAFNPSTPVVEASNSVLLPFAKATAYIDDALMALGLHTEARTSFITYWLPKLSQHTFIALRFLPQEEYEPSAPLSVTPAPDVTTRVFMLFKGVAKDEIHLWENAQEKANRAASIWKEIVGVDLIRATDKTLFRVVEWGGMEVKWTT